MRIMFSCRAMANMAGGVERMIVTLAHAMLARGHQVSLLTWDKDEQAKAFFDMDPRIAWYKLAAGDPAQKATIGTRWRRALKVRRTVAADKPDIIVAFQEGAFIALRFYLFGVRLPIICAERNAPQRFDYMTVGRYRHWIYRAMAFASAITVQLPSYVRLYPWYLRHKMRVIPNPVFDATTFATPAGETCARKKLLCIGRFDYQKNHQVLIRAFVKLAARFTDWDLVLAGGEGSDRPALEQQIADLGLSERIQLLSAVKDVSALYVSSHLFCLPSRWEGFPNNLVEAFAHGLPAVGFANCAGINDLIIPHQNGLLAKGMDDADALVSTLATLMADGELRTCMGEAARQQVKIYQPDRIFDTWEALFKELVRP